MASIAHSPATVVPAGAAISEAPSESMTVTDTMVALMKPPIVENTAVPSVVHQR